MEQSLTTTDASNVVLSPGQSKVFTSKARFLVAISGQRGGKSTVASHFTNVEVQKLREENTSRGKKLVGTTAIICAPTYDLLRTATLDRLFEEYPVYKRFYKEYHKTITIPIAGKGKNTIFSTIYTLSVDDPENLRGKKCWFIWGDEVDIAPSDTWKMMTGRIADHEDGKLLITSTLSKDSWINRLVYQPLQAGKLTNTEIISWPSIERPGFPVEEWERLKAEMDPVAFARDFEGKFAFESGLVYGDILKYGIIDELPENVKILACFYGIDYGLNHPTVIMVMGFGSDRNWYVLNEYVSPMMSPEEINLILRGNLEVFRELYGDPWATYYDPAGGIAALSIDPDVFPMAAVKDIPARVTMVRNFIHQKRVYVMSHCHETTRELGLYEFQEDKPVPKDANNHCMDTMGYIIHNGWQNVEHLQKPVEEKPKSRVQMDLEARGLLKDGIFQTNVNRDIYI